MRVWRGIFGGLGGLGGHVGAILVPRSIFDRFLSDFGGQVGANLGPCWGQVGGMLGGRRDILEFTLLVVGFWKATSTDMALEMDF